MGKDIAVHKTDNMNALFLKITSSFKVVLYLIVL